MKVFANLADLEASRLAALQSLDALQGVRDDALDRVVQIAARLFSAPISLVSLVDADHQSFVGIHGLSVCSTGRDVSFCAHAVAHKSIFVVPDALVDPIFSENPLVTSEPYIRFYAGAPLVTRSGFAVGALCVIDTSPRPGLSEEERSLLTSLADLSVAHLERKRLSFAHRAAIRLTSTSKDAMIIVDQEDTISFWNEAAERTFGFTSDQAVGAPLGLVIPGLKTAGVTLCSQQRLDAAAGSQLQGFSHPDGHGGWQDIEVSTSRWLDEEGWRCAAVLRDVTHRKQAEQQACQLVRTDSLTGLPNRIAFLEQIDQALGAELPYSLLKVGFDSFKSINESRGLYAGDEILQEAARRVCLVTGAEGYTARLGGDELGVLLVGSDDPLSAALQADRILAALAVPYDQAGGEVRLTASVGMVLSPGIDRPLTAHEALKHALLAMQAAKSEGGARHRLFSIGMSLEADERRVLAEALRAATVKGEFELHYQPQVRLSDGAIVGAEALLRWRRPGMGLLSPAAFLLQLEQSADALAVGRWIMEQACTLGGELQSEGAPIRIGVNLFSGQLRSPSLENEVRSSLRSARLRPDLLELEITETTALGVEPAVLRRLASLRKRGVKLAFDDYGTGYASLSLLKTYPISRLKIDRSFITGLTSSEADSSIVKAVIALGRSINLEVIAEGVEDQGQAQLLWDYGCREVQGYLYGRPMPANELRKLVLCSVQAMPEHQHFMR